MALVRYAIGQTEVLESFAIGVEQRFNLWIGRQKKAGREFSEEQLCWLQLIKRYVAQNAEVTSVGPMGRRRHSEQGYRAVLEWEYSVGLTQGHEVAIDH